MISLALILAYTAVSTKISLVDQTASLGLTLGQDAVCLVDLNNDGWTDICGSTGIFLNEKGTKFRKIAEGGSFVSADFDNDGFSDLFEYGSKRLLRNIAGQRFQEVPLPALAPGVCRGACWGDFNNDGFVDLYLGGYEDWDKGITYPSYVLINDKGTGFHKGWSDARFRTRGVTACDFNRDGNLDIYASNYRLQPNQLWVNHGNANFIDQATDFNALATSPGFEGGHSIGAAWGDFDNDGLMDLFAGNFAHRDSRGDQPKSRFLRNMGPTNGYHFEDKGTCGISYQESYATPAAADVDGDGNLDLFFTTVYASASFNTPNYPTLFRNKGSFQFEDITAQSGISHLQPTYQAAWADLNHDGRVDLVGGGSVFENRSTPTHWLEVRLHGDGISVNRSAIGAQVRVLLKGHILTRQVEAGTGEGNQNDLTLHFGLGTIGGSMHVEILWPGGVIDTRRNVHCDKIVDFTYKGRTR